MLGVLLNPTVGRLEQPPPVYHEYRFDVCMLGFVLPPRAELLVLRCELGKHHALLLLVDLGWFFWVDKKREVTVNFVYALAGCCFDPPVVCFRFVVDRVHKTRCSRPDGTISVLTKGDSNKVRAQR